MLSDKETNVKGASESATIVAMNRHEMNERMISILESLDRGGGRELAQNSANNLVTNVSKVDVLSDHDKKTKLPDGELGRKVFQGLERMIAIAGMETKMVIINNFNLQEYVNTSQAELSKIERDVERLEQDISEEEVLKPDKSDFLLKAEVECKNTKKHNNNGITHLNQCCTLFVSAEIKEIDILYL